MLPNPSNSDLVGEAKRLRPDQLVEEARWMISVLGKQTSWSRMERRRKVFADATVNEREHFKTEAKRYREALERIEQGEAGLTGRAVEIALTPDEGDE